MSTLKILFSEQHSKKTVVLLDIIIIVFFFKLSSLLFNDSIFQFENSVVFASSILFVITGLILGIYKPIVGHYSFIDVIRQLYTILIVTLCFVFFLFKIDDFSTDKTFIFLVFLTISTIPYRLLIKTNFYIYKPHSNIINSTLIYGVGTAGLLLKRSLSNSRDQNIIGFIDDNKRMHNRILDAVKIYSIDQINQGFIREKKLNQIIFSTKKSHQIEKFIIDEFKKENISFLNFQNPLQIVNKEKQFLISQK